MRLAACLLLFTACAASPRPVNDEVPARPRAECPGVAGSPDQVKLAPEQTLAMCPDGTGSVRLSARGAGTHVAYGSSEADCPASKADSQDWVMRLASELTAAGLHPRGVGIDHACEQSAPLEQRTIQLSFSDWSELAPAVSLAQAAMQRDDVCGDLDLVVMPVPCFHVEER